MHLRLSREITPPQHLTQIGMRHQTTTAIDHVSFTVFADLDARDDFPYEAEIDLGDDDDGVCALARNCERHVRLRFAKEVNRPVIDTAGPGGDEGRRGRKISLAPDDVP